jgi:predicted ATPase
VLELDVERNDAARQFQVFLTMRDQARFSSRVLSDGTLRVLALLTLLHDPRRRGVLCFEEPENGIHEARLGGLIEILRGFCTDLTLEPEEGERLSQIIVNTHSPTVMRHLKDNEIVAADTVLVVDPSSGGRYRRTRMRTGVTSEMPLKSPEEKEHRLTRIELEQLLRHTSDSIL